MCVTFLLILPSPCQAVDIYIIMKCMYVCHVFAYYAFPLPSCWYIYNDEVSVCLCVCHVFAGPNCRNALAPPARSAPTVPTCQLASPTIESLLWLLWMLIVIMIMIDFKVFIYVDQICNSSCLSVCLSQNYYVPPSWAPQARSEAWEVYLWELYPLDDPPRPSRPKAGLGLVMMMMMMLLVMTP